MFHCEWDQQSARCHSTHKYENKTQKAAKILNGIEIVQWQDESQWMKESLFCPGTSQSHLMLLMGMSEWLDNVRCFAEEENVRILRDAPE